MKIKEFIKYEQPNDYIVSSDQYNDAFKTPMKNYPTLKKIKVMYNIMYKYEV